MEKKFDTLVVITPNDFLRSRSNYLRLVRWLPDGTIVFDGSEEVGRLVVDIATELSEDTRVRLQKPAGGEIPDDRLGFINENDVIPFGGIHKVMAAKMEPLLKGRELPRGITG